MACACCHFRTTIRFAWPDGRDGEILSNGRMELHRALGEPRRLEGFGINPAETRALWDEALRSWSARGPTKCSRGRASISDSAARITPKPLRSRIRHCGAHPPVPSTHEIAGRKGIGLLSFTLLVDPEELKRRIAIYRRRTRRGQAVKFINDRAATFTMVHCAETNKKGARNRQGRVQWSRSQGVRGGRVRRHVAVGQDRYRRLRVPQGDDEDRSGDINFDYMDQNDMIICGDPTRYQEGQALPGGGMPAIAVLHADLRYPGSEMMTLSALG